MKRYSSADEPPLQPHARLTSKRAWRRRFRYAWTGMRLLLIDGGSARVHALASIVVIVAGLLLQVSRTDWALLIIAMAMVWAAEGFNTALELMVDLLEPELRPLAGRVKDLSAGAVLITAVGAAVVGVIVFGPAVLRVV